MLTLSSHSVFFVIFYFVCLCVCVCVRVCLYLCVLSKSMALVRGLAVHNKHRCLWPKRWWDLLHPLCLHSAPCLLFFQPKLALVEERDCLGKDVKRICLVAHQSFQQSIKYSGEGREMPPHPLSPPLLFFFFFLTCSVFFYSHWTELHLKPKAGVFSHFSLFQGVMVRKD